MNTPTLELEIMPSAHTAEIELSAPQAKALALYSHFEKPFALAAELLTLAKDAKTPDEARTIRLKLVKARTGIIATKDAAKAGIKLEGDIIQFYNNKAVAKIQEEEARLEEIEKAAERAEAKRKADLKAERETLLAPFGVNTAFFALDSMPQDAFDRLLSEQKQLADIRAAEAAKIEAARVEALRVAEEARVAKEKADAEERDRVIAENARLKAEADERERLAKIEREAAAEALRVSEAAAKVEREKAEQAAKEAAEIARKEREAIEAKAKAEREALEAKVRAEKAEADKQAKVEREKREALEKAERDRVASENARQAAEVAAIARAAAAPDKEKLSAFASLIETLELPELSTKSGKVARSTISGILDQFVSDVRAVVERL